MIEIYLKSFVNVCKQHGPSLQLVVYTVHDYIVVMSIGV